MKRKLYTGGWDHNFKMNSTKYNHILPNNTPKNLRDITGRDYKNEKKADKR